MAILFTPELSWQATFIAYISLIAFVICFSFIGDWIVHRLATSDPMDELKKSKLRNRSVVFFVVGSLAMAFSYTEYLNFYYDISQLVHEHYGVHMQAPNASVLAKGEEVTLTMRSDETVTLQLVDGFIVELP